MTIMLDNIVMHLTKVQELHHQVQAQGQVQAVRQLQSWQTARLLASHQTLWENKRFRPAMQFFIDELYGPKDFSQRDEEIAKVVPKMAKLLPENALTSLASALHLNSLSFELDIQMVNTLGEQPIDRDSYAQAYRACDNHSQRQIQIELLETLGHDLADVVKIRGSSTLLMLSRIPAKLAGVETLHEFLESGFKAFKKLGEVADFIDPIVNKERDIMNALFDEKQTNPLPEKVEV